MSRSAIKIRDVRSTVRKEVGFKTHRSASLDTRAARGSYVPEKSRPSSEERKSGNKLFNIKWGNAKRSSINLSEAKRKDTRPLTDKAYQKRKVCELAEFLDEMGFTPPTNASKLMSLSKKDFENIFQFLYSTFDKTYEVKKIEEEAPKILKNMCYPFMVNKSAFAYVARANWPTLLGVLIWLMDLNKFAINVDMGILFESAEDEDSRSETHKLLLRYICQRHHSGTDNEEEENAVFAQIIKLSEPVNLEELIVLNEEKKLNLETINKEVEDWKLLSEHKVMLEANIKKYEDYILKMKSRCEKKKDVCEQLVEELKQKEFVLKALEEEVSKKQDSYDAQGYDGKKLLNYFETQKKDLGETLDKKRAVINELHDKLWESEIEYKKNMDKVLADAESFRNMYNSVADQSKTLLQPLLKIKIPQIQNLCSTYHFEFPDWTSSLNKYDAALRKSHRDALNEIDKQIELTDDVLNRIHDSLKKQLNEIEMKISELSAQLKLLSIHENQTESDLSSKKKQVEEEIAALEARCQKIHQEVKDLKTEKLELERTYKEMSEELNSLQDFKEKKKKQLKEYLAEQVEMFKYFEANEKRAVKLSEEYGTEISEKMGELMKI